MMPIFDGLLQWLIYYITGFGEIYFAWILYVIYRKYPSAENVKYDFIVRDDISTNK